MPNRVVKGFHPFKEGWNPCRNPSSCGCSQAPVDVAQ